MSLVYPGNQTSQACLRPTVAAVERVLDIARDVIAIGPGLGQAPTTRDFIIRLVDRATMPLVIDADGLNAFAREPDRLAEVRASFETRAVPAPQDE